MKLTSCEILKASCFPSVGDLEKLNHMAHKAGNFSYLTPGSAQRNHLILPQMFALEIAAQFEPAGSEKSAAK